MLATRRLHLSPGFVVRRVGALQSVIYMTRTSTMSVDTKSVSYIDYFVENERRLIENIQSASTISSCHQQAGPELSSYMDAMNVMIPSNDSDGRNSALDHLHTCVVPWHFT